MMNLRSIKWPLRSIYMTEGENALVLEIGSCDETYSRANVLVDAYEETQVKNWETLMHYRPAALRGISYDWRA